MDFQISPDRMSVYIDFDDVDINIPPEPFEIEDQCRHLGIKVPIFIEEYKKIKASGFTKGQKLLIAEGAVPIQHIPEYYTLEVPVLQTPGTIKDLQKLQEKGPIHHMQVAAKFKDLAIIRENGVIGRIRKETKGLQGMDIYGKKLTLPSEQVHQVPLERNTINFDYENSRLTAAKAGILAQTSSFVFIVPVDTGPRLKVVKSEDNMSALLQVWPDISGKADISQEALYEVLGEQGVVYGIREENFKAVGMEIEKSKSYPVTMEIARGAVAVKGRPEKYELKVPALDKPDKIKELEKLVKEGVSHHYLLKSKIPDLLFLNKHALIGKVQKEVTGVFGRNVLGSEIAPAKVEPQVPALDPDTIHRDFEHERLMAMNTGILVKRADLAYMVPADTGHRLELLENEDHTRAEINIYPNISGRSDITEKEVMELLASHKITTGIKKSVIANLNRDVRVAESLPVIAVIAESSPPKNGKDAYIEYLVDLEGSLKPKILEDGSADFRDVKIVEVVHEGQEIARLVPAEKGVPGINLLGVQLPAHDGKPGLLPVGRNTSIKGVGGDVLVSDLKGIVRREGQLLHVSKGYELKTHVDFSSGNIKYDDDILIHGDVKGGFHIRSQGFIEIKGVVENACVVTHGSVLVRSGFVGEGGGTIRAWGDVGVKFINSQKIYAGGEIIIQKEAVHAELYSRKSIFCCGTKNSFAGGKALVRELMEVEMLGSPSDPKALIILGWDYRAFRILEMIQKRLTGMGDRIIRLREGLEKFEQLEKLKKGLPPELAANKRKIALGLAKMVQVQYKLENRKKAIEARWPFDKNARLVVKRKAFPGTLVQIGYEKLMINKELGRGTFLLKKDGVEFVGG